MKTSISFTDLFFQFIDLYEQGLILEAQQLILTSPLVEYDHLQSQEPFFRYLVNYVDACVFKRTLQVHFASETFINLIQKDKRLSVICQQFVEQLEKERVLLLCYCLDPSHMKEGAFLPKELWLQFIQLHEQDQISDVDIEKTLTLIPFSYHPFIRQKLGILQNWKLLNTQKPSLCHALQERQKFSEFQPWHAFAYPHSTFSLPILKEKSLAVVFLEPIENFDYEAYLAPLKNREVLFIFETNEMLCQLLQFQAVVESLLIQKHHLYVLELYPGMQFNAQGLHQRHIREFQVISMKPIQSALFLEVLSQCILQTQEQLQIDTPLSNWLYQVSKHMLLKNQGRRYGESRALALQIENGYAAWYDKHKGHPPQDASWETFEESLVLKKIKQLNSERQPRPFSPHKKIRLAHVVSQIVDGGHAPTRLVFNLLAQADRDWFDLFLISTEKLLDHPLEYPSGSYVSASSQSRGMQTLKYLHQLKVKFSIPDTVTAYEDEALRIAQFLKEQLIDIVVFHGPDEIHSLCSAQCDVPIRVLFDHGTLPMYPCFDLAILSTEDDYQKHREEYHQKGMASCPLSFSVDSRVGWESQPYQKENFGLPSDSFVMTTISNHLENRLSAEMCQAIGEILQRCPQAYYAPIGPMNEIEKFNAIFEKYGVKERVKFLGLRQNPSQDSRSMDLYLNEFPFGSGLGILDAMAAGCPIVSMYDEHGPQQARYGAVYFGKEWVIHSGKKDDYVELACQLINDANMYQKWSQHALAQYEKHVNVNHYVNTFEKILEKYIEFNSARACLNPPLADG